MMTLTKNTVAFRCPACKSRLAASPLMREAVDVIRRTCRRCHRRYQIKIVPRRLKGELGYVHVGELTPVAA